MAFGDCACGCTPIICDLREEVRALRQRHAEAEKALAQLLEWKDAACKTMQDYVRNAERQAEAVEAAFREGYRHWPDHGRCEDAAWLASDAKKSLT